MPSKSLNRHKRAYLSRNYTLNIKNNMSSSRLWLKNLRHNNDLWNLFGRRIVKSVIVYR